MTEKQNHNLDERVAGLEANAEHVSVQLDTQSRDIKALAKNLQMGFDKISSRDRTQWSPIIAGGAFIVAIVGMYGAGITKDMDRLEAASLRTLEAVQVHAQSEGHAGVRSRLEDLRRDLTGFSERNATQIQSLDGAFHTVTQALRAKDAAIASDVAVNQARLDLLVKRSGMGLPVVRPGKLAD